MAEDIVKVELDGPVALVTLNRPDALNALNRALRAEIVSVFNELKENKDVRAVVLTGAGRAFTAGIDLKEAGQTGFALGADEDSKSIDMARALADYPWPIIGAINGFAITGGFELALMCDVLLASEHAKFADTRVYESDELVPAAMKLAHDMCSSQPDLLKQYKALIDDGYGMNFAAAMKEEVKRSIAHAESVTADAVEEARKQVTARGRDQQE